MFFEKYKKQFLKYVCVKYKKNRTQVTENEDENIENDVRIEHSAMLDENNRFPLALQISKSMIDEEKSNEQSFLNDTHTNEDDSETEDKNNHKTKKWNCFG